VIQKNWIRKPYTLEISGGHHVQDEFAELFNDKVCNWKFQNRVGDFLKRTRNE